MKLLKNVKAWCIALLAVVMIAVIGVGSWLLVKEHRLDEIQQSALEQLDELDGEYDTNKIVLNNTSYSKANALAAQFNAKLRITSDGKFATLTLPEGVTVRDVYTQRENRAYLPDLSLDLYSRVSEEESTEASLLRRTIPSDPYYGIQSYINYLNIGDAWNNYKGNNVTVAVIDTGIDYTHTEFAGKISEYSYNATEDKIVKDYTLDDGGYDWSLIEDKQGHGTSVAGVIAASMDGVGTVGIAPNVTLLVIKAECDDNGNFYNTSDLVFGLYYAVEQDADIVNMSFGTYGSNPFASAAKLAVDSDIVCVAAAGNDGTTTLCYPAADANVIGVGALAQDSWELASYSNYGENVDIVAPGTVYTTKTGGGYGVMNGTSFASPIVAAAVALYRQQNRYCEFANVQEMLYASSYDLGSLGNDWYFGYGALDIGALICEERGTVTFNMLTDELENTTQIFIRNHTLQNLPEPERTYAVFDGWYYDIHCLEEVEWYADIWTSDLTLFANWVNEDDGVPYTYVTLPDNTIEIRSYTGKRRYITIPEMIEGKPVTSIGEFAFDGQTRLREVNLPSSLTNIGAYAFRNCNNLLSITVPEGVTAVGEYAFYNNVRLDSVGFEGNGKLRTVGRFAFAYSGLSRFELPANLTSIDGSAFYGASSLKSITVNKGNTSFKAENGVLFNKTSGTLIAYPAGLKGEYAVPASVRTIGDYAFGYTRSSVTLGNVQIIGAYAFAYSSLNDVVIPDSVTTLGASVFANSFNLREITLGRGLSAIPDYAFANCFVLDNLVIPANILSVGNDAFYNNVSLSSVAFAENSRLLQIGDNAFTLASIKEILFPASLMTIGSNAFKKVVTLSSVTFAEGSSLQVIGVNAFAYDFKLTQIAMPENLMQIGSYAFMGTGLQAVTLPASLTYLGGGAFASCHNLTAINVESGNAAYVSIDGVVYNADKTVIAAYPAGNGATTYTIESTVTEIGEAAFYGSWNLTGMTLPNGLVTVSSYGFYDCENILSYSLPETLTYIESYAFSYNTSLNRLAIPDSVYQIGNYAFAYDYNLRSITFNETATLPRIGYAAFACTGLYSFRVPASVSTIAQGAFAGCGELTQITFAANSKLQSISAYMFDGCTNLRAVTFENGSALTGIQAHGFEGATKLQTVNFGDAKLTNIDNYAFRFCESLTTLSIPDGVTYIGRYAFYGASSLTRLDLPESIDYIGRYAFYGASNLNLYFAAETLPHNLQENWDNGIAGYYVGVTDVVTDGDWKYAVLKSGGISIIQYTGSGTDLDLTSLDFGGDILSIGGYAFYFSDITSIILPNTLTTISAYAFARSGLTSITIPASVECIAQNAFFYTPLTSVTFAENSKLTKIEQYAFAYTRSLQSVTLPASLSSMGSYAFYQSGITVLNFERGIALTEIPQYAFAATKITSVILPDSVTLLNHNAFRDCTYLQTVTYGNNDETYLMSNVFYNTGLTTVVIPSNVTYIGEYALVGLESLTAFEVSAENHYYSSIDGLLYNKDGSKLIAVPAGRTGSIVLPESLEVLGYGAFENTSLEEISFHENSNILTFGYRAFYGAKNLTSVTVPASVVSIDYYAFAMCEKLTSVTFAAGSKLTGVYEGAFYGCRSLKDVLLPDSIVEISDFAFYGCSSLTGLPISETSELKGIYQYAFAYTGIKNLTVPETVIDIGEYAFRGAQLVSVIIPDANAKQLIIGIGAFAECGSLVEITLPFIGASYEDTEITWFGYIFGAGGYAANSTYVPESLKTVTVTEGITFVGKYAFYNLSSLEAINVPHSVSMVYTYAFYGTTAKYELTNTIYLDVKILLNGGSFLGSYTFGLGISGNLVLGEGITSIGNYAFTNCSSLTSIIIPNSVTSIEDYAFSGCSYLINIEIPSEVMSIGEFAFYGCSSLTSIEIPEGVTSIGADAFYGCSSLTSIEIPEGVTSIGEFAFYGCSSLTSIKIPDGVTSIGGVVFADCSSLVSIEIPEGVTSIGGSAFAGCRSLTSIEIPERVTSIGADAFNGCSSLYQVKNNSDLVFTMGSTDNGEIAYHAKVIIDKNGNKTYKDEESGFEYIDTTEGFRFMVENGQYTLVAYFGSEDTVTLPKDIDGNTYSIYQMRGVKNVIIPDSFTTIGDYAFYNCNRLTIVMFGENSQLKSIGKYAFFGCSSLVSIEIPEGVTSIEEFAFYGCISLTSIKIPDGVTSINNTVFCNCISLVSIEIPEGVTSIGSYAFSDCSSLVSIAIPESVMSIGEKAFFNCTSLTSIEISNGVASIGNGVFVGCNKLDINISKENERFTLIDGVIYNRNITQIIYVPDSVTSIVIPATVTDITSAFGGNKTIRNVSFEENSQLKSIGSFAFNDCSSLLSIAISESVTSIGEKAFFNCTSLTNIEIPDSVTSIGSSAFSGCSSLTSIEIPAGVTGIEAWAFSECSSLTSIKIPDGVTSIGEFAFYGCSSLTSIEIPDSVTSIGADAFNGCSSLVSIEIPDDMTSIEEFAFYGCISLTSIKIPDGVTSIGGGAFADCSSLVNIEIPDGVTSIGGSAFVRCRSLTSIEIPEGVTSIGADAFNGCSSLYQVKNNSDLVFTMGSTDNGEIAYHAKVIIDKNGNKTYKDEDSGLTYLDTMEGFLFSIENGEYKLIAYLGSEDTVTLPENINGVEYAIYQMRGVKNVIIPESFTTISDYAFFDCETLVNVTIGVDSRLTTIGEYAFYGCNNLASIIFDVNSRLTTIMGSSFSRCRSLLHIEIPSSVNSIYGSAFYDCSGLESVIFGNGSQLTSIGGGAFSNCSSLTSIEIPCGVTSIGSVVFRDCSNLINIVIPDSVTSINESAFYNTAYYNDASNWVDGCLYIGNALIRVDASAKFVAVREGTTCIADGAFDECYSITHVTLGGNYPLLLYSLTNLETLILTEMPTHYVSYYFGYSASYIPITLKTIIIKEGAEVTSRYAFQNITGVNIFVEANEIDCVWDDVYTGWNNGNEVYYGGEWITAEFYDLDGALIDSSVYLTSQVVRQPYVATTFDEYYTYTVGWDLDGDGFADTVPATSGSNITARAVVSATERRYAVNFYDKDGVTVLYAYILNYGEPISAPAAPVKQGYTFLGWQGYEEGMTVTGNAAIYSLWEHNGVHNYIKTTVAPTCTEEGYDWYVCEICGESYKENFVESIGHSYGEWVVETAATCTEDGLRYRVCENCNETEYEFIAAIGHSYIGVVTKEPTCTEYGEITYTCEHCGDQQMERLEKTEHNYVKTYLSLDNRSIWLKILDKLLYYFFGYERGVPYWYECEFCGEIQTAERPMSLTASVQSVCNHILGEEQLVLAPTCVEKGLYGQYCTVCGELISARTVDALGHDYTIIQVIDPNCTEKGYTAHICSRCDDYYATDFVEALGHSYGEIITVAATCTEGGYTYHVCEDCGYEEILSTTAALGHTASEWMIDKAATCEETGSRHKECTVCHEVLETEAIAKLSHTASGWLTDVAADCTHAGSKHTECTVCGTILEIQSIPATGHSYGEIITVAATCTEGGYTYHVCKDCGYEEILSMTAALGHTASEWMIDKAATCEETGSRHKECTVCHEVLETEAIAKLSHTASGWMTDVAADCTHAGSKHTECTVCGTILEIQSIPATGHNYGEIITVAATCTEGGYTYHVCKDCGYEEVLSMTAALGHIYDMPNIQWTWAEDFSSATATVVCLNDSSHTNTLTATLTSITTAATATEDGNIVYTATVSLDGVTYTDQRTKVIPATGATNEGEIGENNGNIGSGCGGGTGCSSTTMNETVGAVTMLFIVIAAYINGRVLRRKK